MQKSQVIAPEKEKLEEVLSIPRLRHLQFAELVEQFLALLESGMLDNSTRPWFLGLRQHFYHPWVEALGRFLQSRPEDTYGLHLMVRHLNRTREFSAANEAIERILGIWQVSSDDLGRGLIRNRIVEGASALLAVEGTDWLRVEKIYQSHFSYVSYVSQCEFRRIEVEGRDQLPRYINRNLTDVCMEARAHLARCDLDSVESPEVAKALARLNQSASIAIVGKGPSLKGRGLGKRIDDHECVVRINHLPDPHENVALDFGARADIVLIGSHLTGRIGAESAVELAGRGALIAVFDPCSVYRKQKHVRTIPESEVLQYFVESLTYKRATTGTRALTVAACLLSHAPEISAFGFDLYRDASSQALDPPTSRDTAGMAHEIDYEYWLIRSFLPAVSNLKHC